MYLDPGVFLVMLLLALLIWQVFWRLTRWFTNLLIFFLVMAVLFPLQTRGLLGAVMQALGEVFHRLLFVLGLY
ncbi:MAG: hypothetical protein JSS83_11230 [Cyanobacteria bacterium SZAS LIN-3]|nr:hypothetical protein [Cyanobacteria bacterium SZAS LIN-3]MBS2009308.1 hypothetical protein [Cyanobacteria bacterium SZAS TMP-1]